MNNQRAEFDYEKFFKICILISISCIIIYFIWDFLINYKLKTAQAFLAGLSLLSSMLGLTVGVAKARLITIIILTFDLVISYFFFISGII